MRIPPLTVLLAATLAWLSTASAHPGSLDEYPERFPGKTLQTIADEWEPRPADAISEFDLRDATLSFVQKWSKTPAADLKTQILEVLEENRRGDYRKRFANALNDFLDLLTSGDAAFTPEARDYLLWRIDHLDSDDGYFDEAPEPQSWNETKEQSDKRNQEWQSQRNRAVAALNIRADTASNALRPHWLVQCGALEFKSRRYAEATHYFERVREAFPHHPRAEAATLMLARVKLEQWKQQHRARHWDQTPSPEDRRLDEEMREAFALYRKSYPAGRYLVDVAGWDAAVWRTRGLPHMALQSCLLQAQAKNHPEVRRRAFQQIEWLLADFAEDPDALQTIDWNNVAAEPLVALRLCHFMLDAQSEVDLGALMMRRSGGDHRVLESLAPTLTRVRAAAKPQWSRLDEALVRNASAYQGDRAIIRTVLHAWSAIMQNQPALALATLPENPAGPGSDDALHARAIARFKAGEYAEAIRAFGILEQQCPASPLRRGAGLRRADAWIHLNKIAQAIPILWQMLLGHDIASESVDASESPPLHLPGEVEQRMDTLLTFAPLDQLSQAAAAAEPGSQQRTALRGALRLRHLIGERFDEALKYGPADDFESRSLWRDEPDFTARWPEHLAQFQNLTTAVSEATDPLTKAKVWITLGDAWSQAPAHMAFAGCTYLPSPYLSVGLPSPSYQLRHHASLLHLSDTTAAAMLDQHQPHTHAIHCYEEALKLAPRGAPESLTALVALNAALRARAESSPYFRDRAVEKGDAAYSKVLHDRIKTEHPATPAAQQAVWWTFRPSSTLGEWRPGWNGLFAVEAELAALLGTGGTASYWDDNWHSREALENLLSELNQTFASESDPARLRSELMRLRETTRRQVPSAAAGPLLNHIDDLDLLLTTPNLPPATVTAYFTARMEAKPVDLTDPLFALIKDFAAFWNYAITPAPAGDASPRQRQAQAQVARMTAFLQEFPASPKREAALARLAINTLRQSRAHCGMARSLEDYSAYVGFTIERGLPFDPKAVFAALDAYDREFPNGRYTWDLRLIRAIAAAESRDYPTALGHFIAILNAPDHRDLHLDASNNLCAISLDLLDPEQRMPILAAIKATPGAWDKLDLFINSPTCGWRLHILEDWLQSHH